MQKAVADALFVSCTHSSNKCSEICVRIKKYCACVSILNKWCFISNWISRTTHTLIGYILYIYKIYLLNRITSSRVAGGRAALTGTLCVSWEIVFQRGVSISNAHGMDTPYAPCIYLSIHILIMYINIITTPTQPLCVNWMCLCDDDARTRTYADNNTHHHQCRRAFLLVTIYTEIFFWKMQKKSKCVCVCSVCLYL